MNLFHAMCFSVEQYFGLHVLDSVYCSIPSKYHNTVISTTSLLKNKKKRCQKANLHFQSEFFELPKWCRTEGFGVDTVAEVFCARQCLFCPCWCLWQQDNTSLLGGGADVHQRTGTSQRHVAAPEQLNVEELCKPLPFQNKWAQFQSYWLRYPHFR